MTSKIALGGGCHWCTEAVFQALIGVEKVEQGYVASIGANSTFSEAVVVYFNAAEISLATLIEIHLLTHKSTSNHTMRTKYRSAVYSYSQAQMNEANSIIENLQKVFDKQVITKVYPFKLFKASREEITNYYFNNPKKPFCETYITPKLSLLIKKFSKNVNLEKVSHLIV